jgi:tetratricopeptide (TPR) repeat protein
MHLSWPALPFLLLCLAFPQQDALRRHYEAAETHTRAGNLAAAENEYTAILAEGYSRLGKIYSAQKTYQKAALALETAVRYAPDAERANLDLAVAHFQAGQFDKAVEPLQKALARNTKSSATHKLLGNTYLALREYGKAASALEEAVRLAPNDFDTAFTLGIAYLEHRQYESAKRVFGRMPQQFGDQPQLHLVVGRAYREAGLLPEAIAEFTKAASLDPRFPRVHYNLGLAYLRNEGASKLAEAEAEFKAELVSNPDEYFANFYLGIVYIFQRNWDLAIDALQRASRAQPDNPDPYFQLGQAYQELQQHDRAIEVLRRSIALNPALQHNKFQVTTAHYRLAQSLLKTGKTDEGRAELRVTSELKAEAFKAQQQQGDGPSTMGSSALPDEDSEPSARSSAGPVPGSSSAPDEKAAGELKNAEAYYVKVVAAIHNDIGLLRAQQQDFRTAAEHFRLAASWNPHQEGLNFNLGLAYYRSASYREAISPLESEVKAHPENTPARWLLGSSLFMTGSYARASELLSDLTASTSTNVDLYFALASSLIELGKADSAAQVIHKMETVTGDSEKLRLLRSRLEDTRGGTKP